jgi:energy-coupling factor transporter ATP-binding protein EcfA2
MRKVDLSELQVGDVIKVTNIYGMETLTKGNKYLVKDLKSVEYSQIYVVNDLNETTLWCTDSQGFQLVDDEFKVGDTVVIKESGHGTSAKDVGLVCKIAKIHDKCPVKGFTSYVVEIDRDKEGNHDRYTTLKAFRHATTAEEKQLIIPKQKQETMSTTASTSGFQVMIPETAIQERVDKLVMYKLRHEKLHGILSDVIGQQKTKIVDDLKAHVVEKTTEDFLGVKERIIASYLDSKKTQIFIKNELAFETDGSEHKELPKLVQFLNLFQQAMIVGPTGSGKSTLAKQAAKTMNLRYGSFSCNMEASKSELVGFANLNGYITSQFLDFYENGGVFLIDEYDAMSPSIAVVLNAAFDRTGQISVPNRQENPIAKKHKDFYCILAGNTWGSGSVEYQGREMQDMAFLDRFKLCRIMVDYDENIERTIAGDHYEWFMKIRQFIDSNVDSEKFSTRSIHDAVMLLFNDFNKTEILNMLSQHWDEELRNKIKRNVGV